MRKKIVSIVAERENFDYYRLIHFWDHRVEFHPLDASIQLVAQGDPDAVIIDCDFDENRGFSLLREIKTARPEIMVILIFAVGSEDIAVRTFRMGARDYFKKPVDLFKLKDIVEKLLKIKGTSHEKRTTHIEAGGMEAIYRRYPSVTDNIPANILRVMQYIEKNILEELTVDQLAEEAGISKFHFCRTFKKITGMSPMSFVHLIRIERAKVLLRKHIPISSVALKAGFNDLSSFNLRFKVMTGLTPSAYRKLPSAI